MALWPFRDQEKIKEAETLEKHNIQQNSIASKS